MNQSKNNRLGYSISLIAFVLLFIWFMMPYFPTVTGGGMSWDSVNTYVPIIETERVTNWHSALFMYECIGLKYILNWLFQLDFTGIEVLLVLYGIMLVCMLVAISVVFYHIVQSNRLWLFLFPLFAFFLVFALRFAPLGLDFYFCCLLWCLVAVIFSHYKSSHRYTRRGFVILMLTILLHMVAYRRNSVCLVPFVLGYLLYGFSWFKNVRLICKCIIVLVLSVVFAVCSIKPVEYVFPVEIRHPISPMMESDVRIAALLRGEESVFWQKDMVGKLPQAKNALAAYWLSKKKKVEWSEFKSLYVEEWKQNTETMIAAAIIQRMQFVFGSYSNELIAPIVTYFYPIVAKNETSCCVLVGSRPGIYAMLRMLSMAMLPVCLVLAIVAFRRRMLDKDAVVFITVSAMASIIYAMSFMVVVPTPDVRFTVPAVLLALFAEGVFCVSILFKLIEQMDFAKLRS